MHAILRDIATLRNIEHAHRMLACRPTAYPYRPGTIPVATKKRRLAKLSREIAELMSRLAPTV